MATISDELATSIQKCFNQTYTDLANQQSIFFGSGDVTLTKPDGTKGTIRSWNKLISQVDPVIQNAARTDQDTTFNKQLTVTGSINTKSDINARQLSAQSIELSFTTPFIDFHYGSSTSDFTHRIIAYNADTLTVTSNFTIDRDLWISGNVNTSKSIRAMNTPAFVGMPLNDPQGGNGSILGAPSLSSRFVSRGSDGNGQAGCSLWFEEYTGYNHKAVLAVQGYSAQVQYFQLMGGGR